MDDFIQSVTSQLGLKESVAHNATGTVLGFLKNGLGDTFEPLAEKLPGAEQLIASADAAAPTADSGGGGLLGSVTKAASSMLGGGAGEGMELMGSLKNAGLTADQGGSFVTMLLGFIKAKVGDTMLGQMADKIPALKPFLQ